MQELCCNVQLIGTINAVFTFMHQEYGTSLHSMPESQTYIETASNLMTRFADRTGLTSKAAKQRYLWTDAFAVCNFLGLAKSTQDPHFSTLATRLVDQVHHNLGKHRADDSRTGWLSALLDAEAELHPTIAGLRIGKKLPERHVGEAFDPNLEWDRDGQYFHYLTKWMHALNQVARTTQEPHYNLWARELAKTAHDAFINKVGHGPARLVWKMSIDLSRPLVPSTGQHDALDGYVTFLQLQSTARIFRSKTGPNLDNEATRFLSMIDQNNLATADPLGLGGLLVDTCRLIQLSAPGTSLHEDLLTVMLESALAGLRYFDQDHELLRSTSERLAFRELGLGIGLSALEIISERAKRVYPHLNGLIQAFTPYKKLRPAIESFWLDPKSWLSPTWKEHRDINEITLATCLAPEGFLSRSEFAVKQAVDR